MKTAFLIDSMSRKAGGVQLSLQCLSRALVERGELGRVFSVKDEHSEADLAGWDPVPVSLSPSLGPRRFGYAPDMTRELEGFSPDLVEVHGLWTYTSRVSQRWHRKTGHPCFIHPHGMLDPWAVRHSGWKKTLVAHLFENRHLNEAGCLRALCRAEADAIRSYGVRVPIAVIPNGIDLPKEMVEGVRGTRNEEPKTLLYLGRLHPKKGLLNLIRAWSSKATDDWQLVIAGWDEGGHKKELQQLCRELGLPFSTIPAGEFPTKNEAPRTRNRESLTFAGPVFGEAKEALLSSADAFVLPSFSEGLPMTVLEAWAHRLPAVMTDACNLPEGFAAGAGIRVEPTAESVAEGLATLFTLADSDREAMGTAGRRLIEDRFLWSSIASQTSLVHDWLVGGGTRPGFVE